MTGSLTDLSGLDVATDQFLAAVLEAIAKPMWVLDPEGLIRFANPAAIAALGYDSPEELAGRHSHETIHHSRPDGSLFPADECVLLRAVTSGQPTSNDLDWFFRRDGSMFPVSYVSVPIAMPQGRGAVVAFTDVEERVAVERTQRERDALLESQQSAMRRVATLVTGGAQPGEVFAAVAEEVARVLGMPLVVIFRMADPQTVTVLGSWGDRPHPFGAGRCWPLSGLAETTETLLAAQPARIDDFGRVDGPIADVVRSAGIGAGAYAPITVHGQVWGVIATSPFDGADLPEGVEHRLSELTALVASAIANTASRVEVARLADEQAALRRVATLVAKAVPADELFAAVARELGELLGADATHMGRYERDGTATGVAAWSRDGAHAPLGTKAVVDGQSVTAKVLATGRPARMEAYDDAPGPIAQMLRDLGIRSSVGAPIQVDQRLWGVMIASSATGDPLPGDTEDRIAAFSELVATALANIDARAERERLVAEQAALRRVATLVAERVPDQEVFDAVAAEVARLLDVDMAGMIRYEHAATMTEVAHWTAGGERMDLGGQGRWPIDDGSVSGRVYSTGHPARIDDYAGVPGELAVFNRDTLGAVASVGAPVSVDGRLWGTLFVHSRSDRPLPPDSEIRLARFAEVAATAVSNASARADIRRLAAEQTALRLVATLVARECPPHEVFAAVAQEVGRLMTARDMRMLRYDDDGQVTLVASWTTAPHDPEPVGTRFPLEGDNIATRIHRTGRAARFDDYSEATGPLSRYGRRVGARWAVGTPILVNGRLWGVMLAMSPQSEPLAADTEARLGEFTELVATAVANVEARTELAASRARVIAAADDERRRVVRDLHDGAQQRLVHAVVTLKLAERALDQGDPNAPELVDQALDQAETATAELRELVHGILPAVLTRAGLRAGVDTVTSRMPFPVEVDVDLQRLPLPIEATAYFVVAEALANVARHEGARRATVTARATDDVLSVEVRDDGEGGAQLQGSGLIGLRDRLATLGGTLEVTSPAGGGTRVTATIPLVGDTV